MELSYRSPEPPTPQKTPDTLAKATIVVFTGGSSPLLSTRKSSHGSVTLQKAASSNTSPIHKNNSHPTGTEQRTTPNFRVALRPGQPPPPPSQTQLRENKRLLKRRTF